MTYSNAHLKEILTRAKRIAVVGVSVNPIRPSYFVARYLGSLSEIEDGVDMVDIFRRSDAVPEIVDEALGAFADLQTIWMQIGVEHAEAAAKAQARGVAVIQNRCPKIEYQRLFGELRMGGFATGVISSKL